MREGQSIQALKALYGVESLEVELVSTVEELAEKTLLGLLSPQ